MFNVIDDQSPSAIESDTLLVEAPIVSKLNTVQSEAYLSGQLPKYQPVDEVYFQLED
jgi:hypothetical protein